MQAPERIRIQEGQPVSSQRLPLVPIKVDLSLDLPLGLSKVDLSLDLPQVPIKVDLSLGEVQEVSSAHQVKEGLNNHIHPVFLGRQESDSATSSSLAAPCCMIKCDV